MSSTASAPEARASIDLVGIADKILAQQRQADCLADLPEILQVADEKVFIGQDGKTGGAISPGRSRRSSSGIEIGANHPLGGRALLHLGDDGGPPRLVRRTQSAAQNRAAILDRSATGPASAPSGNVPWPRRLPRAYGRQSSCRISGVSVHGRFSRQGKVNHYSIRQTHQPCQLFRARPLSIALGWPRRCPPAHRRPARRQPGRRPALSSTTSRLGPCFAGKDSPDDDGICPGIAPLQISECAARKAEILRFNRIEVHLSVRRFHRHGSDRSGSPRPCHRCHERQIPARQPS